MAYFPNSCNCDFHVAKSQFPENMLCNGDSCHHGLHKWLFRYSPNSLLPDFKISSAISGHPKAHASIKGVNPFWFFVSTGEPKLIRSFAHSNDPLAQASCSGMKPEKKIIFVRSSFWFGYLKKWNPKEFVYKLNFLFKFKLRLSFFGSKLLVLSTSPFSICIRPIRKMQ